MKKIYRTVLIFLFGAVLMSGCYSGGMYPSGSLTYGESSAVPFSQIIYDDRYYNPYISPYAPYPYSYPPNPYYYPYPYFPYYPYYVYPYWPYPYRLHFYLGGYYGHHIGTPLHRHPRRIFRSNSNNDPPSATAVQPKKRRQFR